MLIGMKLEPHELVLYHGRLAEAVISDRDNIPDQLELVDEGGITHFFRVYGQEPYIKRITDESSTVLDAINRSANQEELTTSQKAKRVAETWLADLQVGDVFLLNWGHLLEITELWDNEVIVGVHHPYTARHWIKKKQQVSYDNIRQMRQWLTSPNTPVYRAFAHATLRSDYQENYPSFRGVK